MMTLRWWRRGQQTQQSVCAFIPSPLHFVPIQTPPMGLLHPNTCAIGSRAGGAWFQVGESECRHATNEQKKYRVWYCVCSFLRPNRCSCEPTQLWIFDHLPFTGGTNAPLMKCLSSNTFIFDTNLRGNTITFKKFFHATFRRRIPWEMEAPLLNTGNGVQERERCAYLRVQCACESSTFPLFRSMPLSERGWKCSHKNSSRPDTQIHTEGALSGGGGDIHSEGSERAFVEQVKSTHALATAISV